MRRRILSAAGLVRDLLKSSVYLRFSSLFASQPLLKFDNPRISYFSFLQHLLKTQAPLAVGVLAVAWHVGIPRAGIQLNRLGLAVAGFQQGFGNPNSRASSSSLCKMRREMPSPRACRVTNMRFTSITSATPSNGRIAPHHPRSAIQPRHHKCGAFAQHILWLAAPEPSSFLSV